MKSRSFLPLIIIVAINLFLIGCGKDNEVNPPPTPIVPLKPIALQPTNLLTPFDASFEEAKMIERRTPRLRLLDTKYFRVTGSSRRGEGVEISEFAAYDGKKSLRLLEAQNQSLIIPTSERRKESPLKIQSGGRYRFSANVRFPRGIRVRPSGQVRMRLMNGTDTTGEVFQSLEIGKRDNNNWFLVTAELEIPSMVNSGKLVIQIDGSDDLLIDNLILLKLR